MKRRQVPEADMSLVEPVNPGQPYRTTAQYWVCDCDWPHNHHPAGRGECRRCGCPKSGQPSAILEDLLEAGIVVLPGRGQGGDFA